MLHQLCPDKEYMGVFLKTDYWSGTIENLKPDKCDELTWFDLDNLPSNMVPEISSALENIKNGIFYSEFGW